MTLRTHAAHRKATGEWLHVFVNGEDVTSRCYQAADREGYAYCWVVDNNGTVMRGPDRNAVSETLAGDVIIAPGQRPETRRIVS